MSDVEFKDPLLQMLFEQGVLTAKQAEDVVDEHERMGKPVRELLMDMDLVKEEQLLEFIAQHLGAEVIQLGRAEVPAGVVKMVPGGVARMYNVVPVEGDSHSLTLATYDILSPEMVDELGFPASRLAPAGFADTRPVAAGDSAEARAQNRRIELKLTER